MRPGPAARHAPWGAPAGRRRAALGLGGRTTFFFSGAARPAPRAGFGAGSGRDRTGLTGGRGCFALAGGRGRPLDRRFGRLARLRALSTPEAGAFLARAFARALGRCLVAVRAVCRAGLAALFRGFFEGLRVFFAAMGRSIQARPPAGRPRPLYTEPGKCEAGVSLAIWQFPRQHDKKPKCRESAPASGFALTRRVDHSPSGRTEHGRTRPKCQTPCAASPLRMRREPARRSRPPGAARTGGRSRPPGAARNRGEHPGGGCPGLRLCARVGLG